MTRRVLVLLLAAAALCVPGVGASGADFQAATASPGNSFSTAADFNTVAVALADPGNPLYGPTALSATAASDRGIASVAVQAAPAGTASFTDLCTVETAPYTCTWDSSSIPSGSYDLRAVATDLAGYSRASAVVAGRVVDNLGPAVTIDDPGYLTGTKSITASATDTGTGVTQLTLEYRRPGVTTWTQLCTTPSASLSCPFASAGFADGDLELRAVARDGAANARSTATLTNLIDNSVPTVQTTPPGSVLHGVASMSAAAADGSLGSGVASVTIEIKAQAASSWQLVCVDTTAPYTCSGDTTLMPDGLYDLRATSVDRAGLTSVPQVATSRIDNTNPSSVTLANPGSVVSGSAALSGTAADAGSGIASWRVEFKLSSASTWATACTATTSPYGCSWATSGVADGTYDLRAVATDRGANVLASAPRTGIRVDNLGPAVSLADPGTPLRGTVTLTATASDPAGVTSVVFERAPTGGSAWTAICTDTATPFTCSWNTAAAADGVFDVRARAVDGLGHTSTAMVAARQVDNTAPVPDDLQAGNGGGTAGIIGSGDWIAFTWSEAIKPSTLSTGFTGATQAITVQVTNSGKIDTLQLLDAAGTTALKFASKASDISLNGDFVSSTSTWNATMVQNGATVTVTLGTLRSGAVKAAGAGTMTWSASSAPTDLAGNAVSALTVSEQGSPADLDF